MALNGTLETFATASSGKKIHRYESNDPVEAATQNDPPGVSEAGYWNDAWASLSVGDFIFWKSDGWGGSGSCWSIELVWAVAENAVSTKRMLPIADTAV